MLAVILLSLGIASRLIVHIPDFTPIISVALLSGAYIKSRYGAILLPLALMAVTDVFIGFHETMLFTWGSMVLITVLGFWLKNHKNLKTVLGTSLCSAIIFFVITNLGVWLVSGMYLHTLQGLGECFVLAIPYFRNELASTLIYSTLLFGAYELIAHRLQGTRLAPISLSNK
ncbi:MAG: hypothetical protein A2787_08525 [Omnitrophica WOR_2 bacterium RIFCSPHIGHO2_01_FULL_48_9]|nr:MAG: hypothetical protein A3D10_03235 [Omnitrophica WOR_2 bacterium RIFCSPHIGHO2_02_FULL_48_11]OGX34330.1 MAG: hypothetical protein A2787_08525 [Omnitrophica WOR_2 bacterium RIFCSPHIGHO2_01_FULL_48_9]